METARISEATVTRLPGYLQVLVEAADRGVQTVSSEDLAAAAGVNSAIVRKDLSNLGSYGTRGVGYHVDELVEGISATLGLTRDWSVVIVGIGNLGRALASYGGFQQRGFRVAALVDADPDKIGDRVGDLDVEAFASLADIVAQRDVSIGVIATPAPAAQAVADALVGAGVSAILNFAPAYLTVPAEVTVRKVDLSTELQVLSFYEQLRAGEPTTAADRSASARVAAAPPSRAAGPAPVLAGPADAPSPATG